MHDKEKTGKYRFLMQFVWVHKTICEKLSAYVQFPYRFPVYKDAPTFYVAVNFICVVFAFFDLVII